MSLLPTTLDCQSLNPELESPPTSSGPSIIPMSSPASTPPLTSQRPGGLVAMSTSSPGSSLCDEKTVEYLRDLFNEKKFLESKLSSDDEQTSSARKHIALKLLEQEISRIQCGGKPPGRDSKFVDIYHEKPIRLSAKVIVPVNEHPKFNFVGKLLGPKGNSMKRLQEETRTKMAVLGRGSMRNKAQEEEWRSSGESKYAHLNDELHVEITAFASPSEAYARIAYALNEIRKYLIPDANDEIRQKQMREIEIINNHLKGLNEGNSTTDRSFKTIDNLKNLLPGSQRRDTVGILHMLNKVQHNNRKNETSSAVKNSTADPIFEMAMQSIVQQQHNGLNFDEVPHEDIESVSKSLKMSSSNRQILRAQLSSPYLQKL